MGLQLAAQMAAREIKEYLFQIAVGRI